MQHTQKDTHAHFSHTNTHSLTSTHTHRYTHTNTHTQTWTRPTQPTCSNSLAVTPAFPACLHWGEWELVRETAHYILSPTVLDCTYTAHQRNINYTSLIVIKHTFSGSRQTLYFMHKDYLSPSLEAWSISGVTKNCTGSYHRTASTVTVWHVHSRLVTWQIRGGEICFM